MAIQAPPNRRQIFQSKMHQIHRRSKPPGISSLRINSLTFLVFYQFQNDTGSFFNAKPGTTQGRRHRPLCSNETISNPVGYMSGFILYIMYCYLNYWGHAVAQWLRHYAVNHKIAGSIPDGVIGIFQLHNPSGRTMALGLIQRVTEMSRRKVSWGKGGRSVGLTTLPPSCADCLKIWEPQTPGILRACQGM
jgi:hypothetical protein